MMCADRLKFATQSLPVPEAVRGVQVLPRTETHPMILAARGKALRSALYRPCHQVCRVSVRALHRTHAMLEYATVLSTKFGCYSTCDKLMLLSTTTRIPLAHSLVWPITTSCHHARLQCIGAFEHHEEAPILNVTLTAHSLRQDASVSR